MSEIRRDPIVGYWTIISTERSRRPVEFSPRLAAEDRDCPFCEGRESLTSPEIYAVREDGSGPDTPGWKVRAILSKTPLLKPETTGDDQRREDGIYDLMPASGGHEVLIESPRHDDSLDELPPPHLEKVVGAYVHRLSHLERDPRYQYVLLFKNHGLISGSASDLIRHTRSQLIALPITPKRVKEELSAARGYFRHHERCVFCDVLARETTDGTRRVYENDAFFAFCPFASRSPFEIWILPKVHSADFGRLEPARFGKLAAAIQFCLARLKGLLDDPPYNLVLHTAPYRHRKKALYWQTIEEDYHWYLQIAPRLAKDAGFEWGTGIHINPTPPEEAAQMLREG